MTRRIEAIAIHCSATPNGRTLFCGATGQPGFSTPVQEIDRWHRARGFKRAEAERAKMNPGLCCIGYHYVIYTNGAIASGRAEAEVGAHVAGFNTKSIGVCLVGTDRFTGMQWLGLRQLVAALTRKYPNARVLGHRDFPSVSKLCPGFSVADWLAGGMEPMPGHLLEDPA